MRLPLRRDAIEYLRFAPEWEFICVASPLGLGNSFWHTLHWCIFDFFCDGLGRSEDDPVEGDTAVELLSADRPELRG